MKIKKEKHTLLYRGLRYPGSSDLQMTGPSSLGSLFSYVVQVHTFLEQTLEIQITKVN